jgi:hypothetical protein
MPAASPRSGGAAPEMLKAVAGALLEVLKAS